MENNIYFDQCIDFLARMIEKYGDRIEFPDRESQAITSERKEEKSRR